MRITDDIKCRIVELRKDHSVLEIASIIGCSVRTIYYVLSRDYFIHTADDSANIRSRVRKQIVKDERRRALFGLDQKSNIKVFSNKERITLRYCLKRKGYLFMSRGSNVAYFDSSTIRDHGYEEKGVKLGLKFQPMVIN